MSKMRATIRIYEDPKDFTSADVWEGTSESAMTRVRIYAVMGLFSMATITAYAAWKFSPLSFGFGKSVPGLPPIPLILVTPLP
ncbi:hypothetical protein HHX47_DHR3000727 [Lentinula edodes]|nr:hypothetical protein HHX47_DHR3000727 [Lentinula edodes]